MSPVSRERPRLEHILEITRDLSATISLEQLLRKIVQVAAELTETEGGSILLFDEPSGELRFMATTHPTTGVFSFSPCRWSPPSRQAPPQPRSPQSNTFPSPG